VTPSTSELQRTLECAIGPIERMERRPCPYSSSFQIDELKVFRADGTVLDVIFKNLGSEAIVEKARVKPEFLYNPLREIETYRSVLNRHSLGTPDCYCAVSSDDRHWLFLENVGSEHLWQEGDMESWRNAARWLARLHQQTIRMPHLLQYDQAFYARWWQRAAAIDPRILTIEAVYERAAKRLLELPATFIHGEFYASNVLVQGERICPIDWEMAGCGPGLIDLAALTAGKWDHAERLDFVTAYCGADPGREIMQALDCCRLHLAIRWLGWSNEWQPPVAHATDWRREALQIAGELA